MNSNLLTIHFKLFAKSRELVNKDYIDLSITKGITLTECINQLIQSFPSLTPEFIKRCRIAKDNKYILNTDMVTLEENCTLIIIPPISGG